ncbi:MAG: hypothetical protein NWE78_04635, partial [Candidatus Bathyarchaeota archaeon]|nr:hypothetical protein [Candidatus Bathyarchaeota archaeon]
MNPDLILRFRTFVPVSRTCARVERFSSIDLPRSIPGIHRDGGPDKCLILDLNHIQHSNSNTMILTDWIHDSWITIIHPFLALVSRLKYRRKRRKIMGCRYTRVVTLLVFCLCGLELVSPVLGPAGR